MKIRFACPVCETPGVLPATEGAEWHCPSCDHVTRLGPIDPTLSACPVCGNSELYKQKDFPHTLGMAVLVAALLVSTVTYYLYERWWTWAILLGSAAFDGLLYLWVKDAIVCYRCHAHVGGVPPGLPHPGHELTVSERYRQERIRRERLAAEAAERSPEGKP